MIDWAGKAAWDPVSRRAMWAACGAGNNFSGGYRFNTHSIYDENSDAWSVSRGFQSPNETDSNPIVHMYDSNCIDVRGRRFYKKKFATAEIMVFDLISNTWLPTIASPDTEASYARDGALEVVPSRGAAGASRGPSEPGCLISSRWRTIGCRLSASPSIPTASSGSSRALRRQTARGSPGPELARRALGGHFTGSGDGSTRAAVGRPMTKLTLHEP